MIKDFTPMPYAGINPLPVYVSNVRTYKLIGGVPGGYTITLAKLTVGGSVSAGNPLAHALFESFSDHGEQMKAARTRVSGYDREFIAIKNAMIEAGVEFHPITTCSGEEILRALGEWFQTRNDEIASFSIVSQSCH